MRHRFNPYIVGGAIGAAAAALLFLLAVRGASGQPPSLSLGNSIAALARLVTGGTPVAVKTVAGMARTSKSISETLWPGDGTRPFPESALTMTLQSTSTDDSFPSGTGARTVMVSCLRSDFSAFRELVQMNGTSAVAMTEQCFRINGMGAITHGSGGAALGDITIDNAGSTYEMMPFESGISAGATRSLAWTVPLGVVGSLVGFTQLSGDDLAEFVFFANPPNAGAFTFKSRLEKAPFSNELLYQCLPEGTDIEVRGGTDKVTASLTLIMTVNATGSCPDNLMINGPVL